MADLADMRARLEAIAEELADAGMDVLRQAVADGQTRRPEAERRIAQARRAVERAVAALDGVASREQPDPAD
jgi:hypothetical protein